MGMSKALLTHLLNMLWNHFLPQFLQLAPYPFAETTPEPVTEVVYQINVPTEHLLARSPWAQRKGAAHVQPLWSSNCFSHGVSNWYGNCLCHWHENGFSTLCIHWFSFAFFTCFSIRFTIFCCFSRWAERLSTKHPTPKPLCPAHPLPCTLCPAPPELVAEPVSEPITAAFVEHVDESVNKAVTEPIPQQTT